MKIIFSLAYAGTFAVRDESGSILADNLTLQQARDFITMQREIQASWQTWQHESASRAELDAETAHYAQAMQAVQ